MRIAGADRRHGERQHGGNRGKAEDGERQDEHRQHGELHLARFDLLAEELRCAAHHQAGDEHRQDAEHQHAVEPRADTAGQDLAQLHQEGRHQPAQRRERAVHTVDAAIGNAGGRRAIERGQRRPKRTSLPSMLPMAGSTPSAVTIGLPAVSAQ